MTVGFWKRKLLFIINKYFVVLNGYDFSFELKPSLPMNDCANFVAGYEKSFVTAKVSAEGDYGFALL